MTEKINDQQVNNLKNLNEFMRDVYNLMPHYIDKNLLNEHEICDGLLEIISCVSYNKKCIKMIF